MLARTYVQSMGNGILCEDGVEQACADNVRGGDTIQVGYGSLPNAILTNLRNKKNLGVHSELLTPGMVDLMKEGILDNSQKSIDRGKTVASFCLGNKETYDFIHDNPGIEFRTIDYTNSPLVISKVDNMVAINSAGFTAGVLGENIPILTLIDKLEYPLEKRIEAGVFGIKLLLDNKQSKTIK